MACPECRCKVTYSYYENDFDSDTNFERCAYCGHIFDIEMALDDDDDLIVETYTTAQNSGQLGGNTDG